MSNRWSVRVAISFLINYYNSLSTYKSQICQILNKNLPMWHRSGLRKPRTSQGSLSGPVWVRWGQGQAVSCCRWSWRKRSRLKSALISFEDWTWIFLSSIICQESSPQSLAALGWPAHSFSALAEASGHLPVLLRLLGPASAGCCVRRFFLTFSRSWSRKFLIFLPSQILSRDESCGRLSQDLHCKQVGRPRLSPWPGPPAQAATWNLLSFEHVVLPCRHWFLK